MHRTEGLTLGARLKASMWKGFGTPLMGTDGESQETDSDDEETEVEDVHDDGNETETPAAESLTSRLATTVWRGITNQSSMDDEIPSPPTPPSGLPSSSPKDEPKPLPTQPAQTKLWDYAGKLKNSDTVAAFSKVSTNWRARAMNAWGSRRGNSTSSQSTFDTTSPRSAASELPPPKSGWPDASGAGFSAESPLRSSFSNSEVENPPRPVFRSPRESFLPQPRRQPFTAPSSPEYPNGEGAFMHKTKASLASLTSLPMRSAPAAKSGPRPLLLNSQTLITTNKPLPAHSGGGTPPPHRQGQWADVPLSKSHALRQESMSSISSLSLPDILNKSHPHNTGSRSDYNSDENSCSSESGLLSTLRRFASKFDPLAALLVTM